MSLYSNVTWKEGMFLVPQHFQQAERALDSQLHLRVGAHHPHAWGVITLKLDETGLREGRLSLLRCQAILPDGTSLQIPEVDPAPPTRTLALSASMNGLDVFLTLPAAPPHGLAVTADPSRADVRFVQKTLEVSDVCNALKKQKIEVSVKNVRLTLEGEPLDGLVSLRVARVILGRDGRPALDEAFLPPSLSVGASPALERLLKELVSLTAGRARALADEKRPKGLDLEMVPSAVTGFLFMQTLFRHLPVLQRILDTPATHPAALFERMQMFAGDLFPFELGPELGIPPYQHESPYPAFAALAGRLRDLIARPFQSRYLLVPLLQRGRFWHAEVTDESLRQRGQWVLAVTSELPQAELLTRLPQALRASERDQLEQLIMKATGGLRVSPLPRAPEAIPVDPRACYFQFEADGQSWSAVRASGRLALFFPGFLTGVQPALYIIRTGRES